MATTVTVGGISYSVPSEGDGGYANDLTNLLIQMATSTKVLQVSSSSFPLLQELSFGTSYGVKSLYLKSTATNPAGTGIIRLGNEEKVSWRNAGNTADLDLKVSSTDELQFNGTKILSSGAIVNADVDASAAIVESKLDLDFGTSALNTNINNHIANTSNPHTVTKAQVLTGNLIVNADVDASAAIAESKLSLTYGTSTLNTSITTNATNISNHISNATIHLPATIGSESQIISVVSGAPTWTTPASAAVTPVGSILPWIGGYFGNSSNGTYTNVLGNTVSDVNTLLNSVDWYVCDGSAVNDADSPIFNGASRYLPNLTDDRFLQGSTVAGGIGGSNTMLDHTHTHSLSLVHTHSINHDHASFSTASGGSHTHDIYAQYIVFPNGKGDGTGTMKEANTTISSSGAHTHSIDIPSFTGTSGAASATTVSGSVGTGSAATSTENRPQYLSVFYIMKVK